MIETDMRLDTELESELNVKKIIYINKATFERARLDSDFFSMRASLQNIYDNLYYLAKRQGHSKLINYVASVFKWYDNLNVRYRQLNSDGTAFINFPDNISIQINNYFSGAYIKLNKILGEVL